MNSKRARAATPAAARPAPSGLQMHQVTIEVCKSCRPFRVVWLGGACQRPSRPASAPVGVSRLRR